MTRADEAGITTDPHIIPNRVKYILTLANYITNLGNGIAGQILPPARLDIAEIIGSNFKDTSYGQSCRSAGYIMGCIVIGWMLTRINRQLGLVFTLILSAISLAATPFTRTLWSYMVTEFTFGIFSTGMDIVTNSWLLEIWQESANPFMQGMHFCYAVGMVIAPLMIEPFLSYDRNVTDVIEFPASNGTRLIHEGSRILIPYSISAGILFATAIMILVLFFTVPYKDPQRKMAYKAVPAVVNNNNNNTIINDSTTVTSIESESQPLIDSDPVNARKEKMYYIQLITLSCLLFVFYTGVELSTINFIPEFAVVIALKLSKSKAAFLSSVMSASFATSRLLSIAVACKLKTKKMIYMHTIMVLIGNVILVMFANNSETMLWIAVIIIGAGHSCLYPCLMSFLEERIHVTTIICSAFSLSTAIVSIFIPIIMGSYIESFPMVYVYVNMIGLVICFALFAALYVIDRRFRRSQRIRSASLT